ncbi:MAG: pyridoxamine 5'-phosphate oxidase family protein [Acidimicrobiia bacterium]|nr:pyridoxamine 5'-phosphate oxidase family protein [Acidimicrobiia bacterium]
MTRDKAVEFLTAQLLGHLAVIDGDEPYVSPISYVVADGTLFFRTRPGRRLEALKVNPRLCIETSLVDDDAGMWASVCAWGNAEIVEDSVVGGDVVSMLLDKYADASEPVLSYSRGPNLGTEAAIVAVPLDEVTGRVSGSELGTHIRPGRL